MDIEDLENLGEAFTAMIHGPCKAQSTLRLITLAVRQLTDDDLDPKPIYPGHSNVQDMIDWGVIAQQIFGTFINDLKQSKDLRLQGGPSHGKLSRLS